MGANNDNDKDSNGKDGDDSLMIEDKRVKKTLLIDTIMKKCASSSHEILQQINNAINSSGGTSNSKLEAAVLSGGYTNYSYKVFVDNQPELCVFAKLCFEFALWNPDKTAHYDLERTENEYKIMETISSKTHGSIVAPLGCWDLNHEGQKMKILVTEWSKGDEQFSNQFIDGAVDPRIAPKIAETVAALHIIEDFDPDFNQQVKPCMENLLEHMKSVAREASKTQDPKDRTEAYCATLGEDVVMNIINANIANYHQRDCLIHSDCHAFNILVEAKPSIEELEAFGMNGTMVLCDWEMAMAGPIGRDIGLAMSFPIGCMIAHAMDGHSEANESIEIYINTLIDTYCSKMTDAGKTEKEMAGILRNIVGWCGWFSYLGFYVLNVQDSFPVESEENKKILHDTNGIIGMKLLRLAYDNDYVAVSTGFDDIRKIFNSLREEEVTRAQNVFTSRKRRMQPRKSSMLRATNRRLSDTEMLSLAAESVKRFSSRFSITENMDKMERSLIAEDDASSKLGQ